MPEICPFLAASHDPDSVLNYPSAANVCTKLGEPQPVATDHQAGYCLRARHWFCPVYTGAIKQPPIPIQIDEPPSASEPRPPRELRLKQARRTRDRRALVALLLVAIGGGAVYGVAQLRAGMPIALAPDPTVIATVTPSAALTFSRSPTDAPSVTPAITDTATPEPSATLTIVPANTFTPPPTETVSATPSPTATPTAFSSSTNTAISPLLTTKACEVPTGWQRYTVAPGETYYRIAVKFGTTVEALQHVNCLAAPDRLLAGQVISVPPTPTKQP